MHSGINHLSSVHYFNILRFYYDFLTTEFTAITDLKIIKLNKNTHCDIMVMVNLIFGIRPI
jgi:hypothetical protein